ncbi:MAG: PAS domain-containing sensor histidine kinase [Herminiimonas sp.]|nr:PAS domain-containing sensor histidine kinase [Herminiimonas sp.]
MLTARPHDADAVRFPPPGTALDSFTDLVAEARTARVAQAEVLARRGTVEIYLDFNGAEVASVWSHGIYALLERDPLAGPLTRGDFILQHVHCDDQRSVTAASRDLFNGDAGTELRYRIVTTGEQVVDVRESTSRVASDANGEVIFSDMEVVRRVEQSITPLAPLPAAVHAVYGNALQAPAPHALIAVFDALRDCEQRRLTREMHDEFGQLLAAMKVDLALLQRDAALASYPLSRHVVSLHELVDAMLISVRRIIADLPPLAIEEHGIFGALERLACNFRKRHAIQIQLHIEANRLQMSQSLELSVYRIIQEALNNVVRHANARNALIRLRHVGGNLVIAIEDDGQGASNAQLRKIGSYGLASMQERVAALDGTIAVRSNKGSGTRIEIAIPANASAAPPG